MTKEKKSWIKNLIPILAVFASSIIIFVLVIPLIQDLFKNLEAIEVNYSNISELDQKLRIIEADIVNSSIYASQLTKLDSLSINNNVQIIEFRDRIANIARRLNLVIGSEKISETSRRGESSFVLTEVPFEFEISGNFEGIKLLIDEFDNLQEIIVIREMSLAQTLNLKQNLQTSDDQWTLRITLSRYIFPQSLPSSLNLDFSQLQIPQGVINFLN